MTPNLLSGGSVWLFLLGAVVQVTILILATICVTRILRPRNAAVRHGLWLGTLIAVLLIPVLSLLMHETGTDVVDLRNSARNLGLYDLQAIVPWPAPTTREPKKLSSLQVRSAEVDSHSADENSPAAVRSVAADSTGQAQSGQSRLQVGFTLLIAVWAAGIVWGFFRLLHGCVMARRLMRESQAIHDERITRPLETAMTLLNMTRKPAVLTSSRTSTPLVVGLVRPVLVLPAGIVDQLDQAQFQDILIHELAHIVRGDNWIGLLQRFVAVLWWPHPLVHLLNRMLARAREEVCDNYTLVHGDRHQYARTLLYVSQQASVCRPLVSTVGLLHPKWRLEERVAGLLDESRSLMLRVGRRRSWGIASLLGLCVLFLSGSTVMPPSEAVMPHSEEEAIQHIRSLGGHISEGNLRVMIARDWTGTVDDLDYLKCIDGIKEIWFSGTEFEEVRLEDLPDLEKIIFNVNFYDNAQRKQVRLQSLPIRKIRLKNLPKLTQLDRLNMSHTEVTLLELVDMVGLTSLEAEGLQVTDGVLASVSGAPNLTRVGVYRRFNAPTNGRTEVTDGGLNGLAYLKNLSMLTLDGGRITNAGLRKIGECTSLASLGLASTDITDAGLTHLKKLENLQYLGLNGTAISDNGLRIIVQSHPAMKSINLAGTEVTAAGLESLRKLPGLTSVNLDTHQLTEQSCRALNSLPLKTLFISGHSDQPGYISGLSKIGILIVEGPKNLTVAPTSLAGLKNLVIRGGAGPGTVRSLFSHLQYLKSLEKLEVRAAPTVDLKFDRNNLIHVDDELMQHVVHLTSLKLFRLNGPSRVGDAGVAHLARLKSLEQIQIPWSQVTDAGAASFAELENLKYLELFSTKITNGGLIHFRKLKKLEKLYLNNTQVDRQGVASLKAHLPNTAIQAHQFDTW
jgi:beta-lactamase regulating signal transducer with metallopeptidase domain